MNGCWRSGRAAAARPRRQGDRLLERPRARRSRRGRAPARAADWLDAAPGVAEFLLGPLSTPDGRLLAVVARRPGERRRLSGRLRKCLRTACWSSTSRPVSCAGCSRRSRLALLAVELFGDEEHGGFFLAPGGRRSAGGPHEGSRRQPDPVGKLDARLRAAASGPDLGRRRARATGRRCAPARGAGAEPGTRRFRLGPVRTRPLAGTTARARDRRGGRLACRTRVRWRLSSRTPSSRSGRRTPFRCSRGRARRRRTAVYICERFACQAPVTDPGELEA